MYTILLLVLFLCSNQSLFIKAMEEQSSKKLRSGKMKAGSVRVKRASTKYAFDKEQKNSSSLFENQELRHKASTINRSQQFLRFLSLELKTEHKEYEDTLTQFELLTYLHSKYLASSTLNNAEGDCLDATKAQELKSLIYSKGSMGYFKRGLHYKIQAERRYAERAKKSHKKQENMKHIMRLAKNARADFQQAYDIDNNHGESLKFVEEMDVFIGVVQEEIYDSPSYIRSTHKAKKAVALEREARGKIVSARGVRRQDIPEEKELEASRRRSKTFESLKRIMQMPKYVKLWSSQGDEKEESIEYQENYMRQRNIQELENAENLRLKAIAGYFEAFEDYKAQIFLDKIQNLLERVNELERERYDKTPNCFIIKPEIGVFQKQLEENYALLKKMEEKSSSSSSE